MFTFQKTKFSKYSYFSKTVRSGICLNKKKENIKTIRTRKKRQYLLLGHAQTAHEVAASSGTEVRSRLKREIGAPLASWSGASNPHMVGGPLWPTLYKEVGARARSTRFIRATSHPTDIPYRSRVRAVLTGSTTTVATTRSLHCHRHHVNDRRFLLEGRRYTVSDLSRISQ
jgi:hypothetical protein